jgi:response regulator RpfG family c-di-GMP phosphodiesterase
MVNDTDRSATHILIVEDRKDVLAALEKELASQGYNVTPAQSAIYALNLARERQIDIALCEMDMAGVDGLQFTQSIIKIHPQMPIVLLIDAGDFESGRRALEAGASDFVTKPIDAANLRFVLENSLQRKRIEIERLSEQRAEVLFKAIKGLAAAVDAKSNCSDHHTARTAELCLEIGAELGLSEERLSTLELAAHVHDLGKIGIPDEVLSKPGKLTDDEWVDILRHPSLSAGFLSGIDELAEVASIVRHHHERMDGCGYPDGFKGDAIPFLSRILAVADAFEAMTSPRPYRSSITWEEALEELRRNSGTQFDPLVVDAVGRVVHRATGADSRKKAA